MRKYQPHYKEALDRAEIHADQPGLILLIDRAYSGEVAQMAS
jgi:hypothetical protein